MSSLVVLISVLIIIAIAVAVISKLALTKRTKDQWRDQVKTTAQVVRERQVSGTKPVSVPLKRVSFQEIWEQESRSGTGYITLETNSLDVFPKARAPKTSDGATLKRSVNEKKVDEIVFSDANPERTGRSSKHSLLRTSLGRRFPTLIPIEGNDYVDSFSTDSSDAVSAENSTGDSARSVA